MQNGPHRQLKISENTRLHDVRRMLCYYMGSILFVMFCKRRELILLLPGTVLV
jgi:hypothetical protein